MLKKKGREEVFNIYKLVFKLIILYVFICFIIYEIFDLRNMNKCLVNIMSNWLVFEIIFFFL